MEEKREKVASLQPKSSSSMTMPNSVAFSDEIPTSSFSFPFSPSLSSIFDIMTPLPVPVADDQNPSSFGAAASFMDLLNFQDYTCFFDDSIPDTTAQMKQAIPSPASCNVPDGSEVLNTPISPNSSSISCSSNEAAMGTKGDEEKRNKKQWIGKKKKEKKAREPKFAFMTKSEVDHLDDGYRWRKYGQKAVKNSPHPRSYYRCTTTGCGVKKRVERCSEDPTVVVTTYEGQHTHPCPATSRGATNLGCLMHMQEAAAALGGHWNYSSSSSCSGSGYGNAGLSLDNGLLQDILYCSNSSSSQDQRPHQ